MSSVSSNVSIRSEIPIRKDSICEEPSPVDDELSEVIALCHSEKPDCTRNDEIMAAICHCKSKLKECLYDVEIPNKQIYFDKLVQLSLEKQELEENDANISTGVTKILGHEFVLQRSRGRRNPYCEVCIGTIWRLVQSWRRCRVCGFRAHEKCVNGVHRVCAGIAISRNDFCFSMEFCEERGLCAQNYACAECDAPLQYEGPSNAQPRLCEFTGLLFCSKCHWGDLWSIPARIFHNMDATPRPVCRAAKQLLAIVDIRPLINMSLANPSLFKYHKELRRVQLLRRNFLFMKCYFICCRNAAKLRILQYLNRHQYFVDGADMYSLADLRELCMGDLLQDLEDIYAVFRRHIEEECEICRGNGFYCELCDGSDGRDQIIFPFSKKVSMCQKCFAVFHSKCFETHNSFCTRCERRKKRELARQQLFEEEE
ncbi:phorbol esters/diacylglycerol binding domain protein [Dictyocaulus viviparus]|uniref:Phorbol esters/diacylglycerol binding domain protein n=1 Tax=Dictyocaulus viviparus TaxID=29172 RepID=A0A0D8Y3J5_DICVI|nr:phorbol esters/diacylglycerol binding domain protein [Dictyocaulus viviparus]